MRVCVCVVGGGEQNLSFFRTQSGSESSYLHPPRSIRFPPAAAAMGDGGKAGRVEHCTAWGQQGSSGQGAKREREGVGGSGGVHRGGEGEEGGGERGHSARGAHGDRPQRRVALSRGRRCSSRRRRQSGGEQSRAFRAMRDGGTWVQFGRGGGGGQQPVADEAVVLQQSRGQLVEGGGPVLLVLLEVMLVPLLLVVMVMVMMSHRRAHHCRFPLRGVGTEVRDKAESQRVRRVETFHRAQVTGHLGQALPETDAHKVHGESVGVKKPFTSGCP